MINNIEIFDVNFGDCFICQDNSMRERMLVDFGSIRKIKKSVINEVNLQLGNADKKHLMISHFHSDHYSGIKHLLDTIKFDEIYLPNFFSKEVIKLQYTILLALSPSNRSYTIAYNMLSVIPNLVNHIQNTTKIIFTRRGDIIKNNIDSLRVLWPDNADFDKRAKKIYEEIVAYYKLKEKEELINKFVEDYFSTILPLREDDNTLGFIQTDENQLKKLLSLIENLELSLKESKAKPKKMRISLNKEISFFQNSICICFDNVIENNDKPVLFLSDISQDIFGKILNGAVDIKLAEHYSAIKVPHHGTKDYYVNDLPESNYMIISNGLARTNSWRITALYGWKYNGRNFICTNYPNACDYELASVQCDACKSARCICGIINNFHLSI